MPHRENTYAALDLGSNSFHLVIARKENDRLFFVDRQKFMVRLADGLDSELSLKPKAQERALDALAYLEERIRGFPEDAVRVVGTNTLRAAKNAEEFLHKAEAAIGFPIAIINGREEARLVFKGVTQDLTPVENGRFVIDIGGGSTELIWGHDRPQVLESLHMGCVSFSKRFFPDGRVSQKAYNRAFLAAQLELAPVLHSFESCQPTQALGSSGTIKAIEQVLEQLGYLGSGISVEGLEKLVSLIVEAGHTSKLHLAGLKEERAPVFPGGLSILHAVLSEIQLPPLHASQMALREGVLYELIGRRENVDQRELTVAEMMERYSVDPKQAERVSNLSRQLCSQLVGKVPYIQRKSGQYLHWASSLHEIGLSISHSGYHKHGAYLIANSDMAGFNRTEKRILSFLVGNHRRKIRESKKGGMFEPPWALLLVLRVACLLLRSRKNAEIPPIQLEHQPATITLQIDAGWMDEHPLTASQLELEKSYWKAKGKKFKIKLT